MPVPVLVSLHCEWGLVARPAGFGEDVIETVVLAPQIILKGRVLLRFGPDVVGGVVLLNHLGHLSEVVESLVVAQAAFIERGLGTLRFGQDDVGRVGPVGHTGQISEIVEPVPLAQDHILQGLGTLWFGHGPTDITRRTVVCVAGWIAAAQERRRVTLEGVGATSKLKARGTYMFGLGLLLHDRHACLVRMVSHDLIGNKGEKTQSLN
mmetsp:Transcript_22180/g.62102  ORF Transcript_22180/g.62102 Transcript_22180/m.62102 type:complete len:208 (-) Transcript_22180:18-641(-)